MEIKFEWDPTINGSNRQKHGVSFEQAASIFLDAYQLTIYDYEHSDNEERWVTIARSLPGQVFVVVHTVQYNADESVRIRMISARRATTRETQTYSEREGR